MTDKRSVNTPQEVGVLAHAWALGATLQRQCAGTGTWSDRTRPEKVPEFDRVKYRVKPEPEEVFIIYRNDGSKSAYASTQQNADRMVNARNRSFRNHAPYSWKRFVEAE